MNQWKEVLFDAYCEKCVYRDVDEWEDPCNECLAYPAQIGTHKPLNFKEETK